MQNFYGLPLFQNNVNAFSKSLKICISKFRFFTTKLSNSFKISVFSFCDPLDIRIICHAHVWTINFQWNSDLVIQQANVNFLLQQKETNQFVIRLITEISKRNLKFLKSSKNLIVFKTVRTADNICIFIFYVIKLITPKHFQLKTDKISKLPNTK
jgi:hypothetical protein